MTRMDALFISPIPWNMKLKDGHTRYFWHDRLIISICCWTLWENLLPPVNNVIRARMKKLEPPVKSVILSNYPSVLP
jgi:hypothetical protein